MDVKAPPRQEWVVANRPEPHKKTSTDDASTMRSSVDIIDDDASVLRALRRLLVSVGIRSEGYRSAQAYLDSVDLELADCLLLDMHLPGMSGIELLEHLRKVAPRLPVICMTGRHQAELEKRASDAGGCPFLRKPFDQAELFDALSTAGVSIPSSADR